MHFDAKHPSQLFKVIGREYFDQLLTASAAGEGGFRENYLPMAERLAMMVQELPLEKELYSEPGGALRFGLLAGLGALRLCDGVIFKPGVTAQTRMRVEPQYRWASWCATLACVPLIVAHHASLSVNGQPWSFAHKDSLWDACGNSGCYSVDWLPVTANRPSAALASIVLSRFFFPGQFASIDSDVLLGMCEAINPAMIQAPAEQSLSRVVRVAQEKIRLSERQRLTQVFSATSVAVAISPNALAALDSSLSPAEANLQTPDAQTAQAETASFPIAALKRKEIPEPILAWVRALAADPDSAKLYRLASEPDKGIVLSAKALRFGFSSASDGYATLHAAGVILEKREKDVLASEDLANAFRTAIESSANA